MYVTRIVTRHSFLMFVNSDNEHSVVYFGISVVICEYCIVLYSFVKQDDRTQLGVSGVSCGLAGVWCLVLWMAVL